MSQFETARAPLAQKLTFAEISGLAWPNSQRWNLIRFQQVSELLRLFQLSIAANILNAIFASVALAATFGLEILVWAAAILSVSFFALVQRVRKPRALKPRPVGRNVIVRLTIQTALLGLLWLLLPLIFFGEADATQRVIIMAVIAGMMAGGTLMFSTLPSAGLVYLALTGMGGLWMALTLGSVPMVMMTIIYTGSLCFGMVSNGRAFVRAALLHNEAMDQKQTIALLLREVEESEGDWLWEIDASLNLSRVSPRMARCLALDEDRLMGMAVASLLQGDSADGKTARAPIVKKIMRSFEAQKPFVDRIVPLELDGKTRWLRLSANPIFDETGKFSGFRGVGSDITELRHSEEKISHMARFDALTGLPNRTMVHDALEGSLRRTARNASASSILVILDLDRFKIVNDTLGHPVGDRLLCEVAGRVRNRLQRGQTLGRIGGDEFAIVMGDGDDAASAEALARDIIETISAPYKIDEHNIAIGASAGIAMSPVDGSSVEVLLRNADLALYNAKEKGRGSCIFFELSMHTKAEERRRLEIDLRSALVNNQLRLVYQPIVSVDGKTIRGFEALLRWTHPELGEISPVKFIPIAEESGLIDCIGEWVVRTACMTARDWPSDVKVSVNISPLQFLNSALPTMVMSALSKSGIDPRRLELEITEGVFLLESDLTTILLAQLKAIGVGIALDDFGTGYSSLGYLQKTTFSTIKIDRSFIHGTVVGKNENSAIIRAIVAMADSLEITTTAEGAENDADLDAVKALGCKQVQGWVFGRPMEPAAALELFETYKARAAA